MATPATEARTAPFGRVRGRATEPAIVALLFACASVAVVATLAIFLTLLVNGWEFFRVAPLLEFFTGTTWAPDFVPRHFGMLPLLKGSLYIGGAATLLAIPLGLGSAIYLAEYASPRVRSIVKPSLELFAGIPSITFGIVALFIISPRLQDWFDAPVFTAAAAILMLALMVVPIIASVAEDSLRAAPQDFRAAALALGATRWESTWGVVVPAASSGITAAILLGLGRAVGETMVVTLAAGLVPTMSLNPLSQMQTITAFIANRAGGDLPAGSVEYVSIFALGAVLFAITFVINLAAQHVLQRQRRMYG